MCGNFAIPLISMYTILVHGLGPFETMSVTYLGPLKTLSLTGMGPSTSDEYFRVSNRGLNPKAPKRLRHGGSLWTPREETWIGSTGRELPVPA